MDDHPGKRHVHGLFLDDAGGVVHEDLQRKPLAINKLNNLVVTKLICHEIFRFDYFAAMKNPIDGYHKIEFEEDPPEIYLEAKQVEKNAAERQKTYSFPVRQHL